jgi:hypothetical protein
MGSMESAYASPAVASVALAVSTAAAYGNYRKALVKACREGDVAGARRAVGAGADPNEYLFSWTELPTVLCTPTLVAAMNNRVDVLRYLVVAAGADPDKGDNTNGWTPCYIACWFGHAECVRVLLAAGADPNHVTIWAGSGSSTPCMVAAENGRVSCLRALREYVVAGGETLASVNALGTGPVTNVFGTALDIAEANNQDEAAAYLRGSLGALRQEDLPLAPNDDQAVGVGAVRGREA